MKSSTWNTDIKDDLEQIQNQEDIKPEEDADEGPLGLKPFSASEWSELKPSTIEQYWGDAFIFEKSEVTSGQAQDW